MAIEQARGRRYTGILFTPDGDWVTDFKGGTKKEVIDQLADRGSRWYFYPYEGVIRYDNITKSSHKRLVDAAPPIEFLRGKSVSTVSKYLKENKVDLP